MEEVEKNLERLHAFVEGRVQGVNFRFFVRQNANQLGITGWVRNRWDGSVEVVAEGEKKNLQKLLNALHKGPPASRVLNVKASWLPATGEFSGFRVRMTA